MTDSPDNKGHAGEHRKDAHPGTPLIAPKENKPAETRDQILDSFIKHLACKQYFEGELFRFNYNDLLQVLIKIKATLQKGTSRHSCAERSRAWSLAMFTDRYTFFDLSRIFDFFSQGKKAGWTRERYVFLGGYVDRAKQSLECVVLLFLLKIRNPKSFVLLRGTNECKDVNRELGFRQSLVERLGQDHGSNMFHMFNEAFTHLPIACLVGNCILCVHGGISPKLTSLDDIMKIPKPLEDPTDDDLACDLLWSEPMYGLKGFADKSPHGVNFGTDVLKSTVNALKVKTIVRGRQMIYNGFAMFGNVNNTPLLTTLFSAPSYTPINKRTLRSSLPPIKYRGAAMSIGEKGNIGLHILSQSGCKEAFRQDYEDGDGFGYEVWVDDKKGCGGSGK